MTAYDQGYQDAIRNIYTALGMAITQPLDEDHAPGYMKILKQERDEARAAYEAETQSTAQIASECTRIHSLWHGAEEKLNVYRESLDNYDVTVKNLEDVLCKKRSEIDRLKNELIIAYTPESRNDH